VAPEEEYTYPAPEAAQAPAPEAAQAPAPAPEPEAGAHDAGDMWWWQKSPDDTLQLSWEQLIFILVLVVVVPCCTCTLVFRFCCRHHHIKQAPRDGSGGSGTGKTAFNASPHERGTMPSARGLDDYDERSQMGGGESTASMMPDTLKFLQQGMENLQGGLGDLADAAMNAAAMVSTAPFEEEDDSPYAVIVSFCRDAHGCLGVDAAHEIYDQCTARGLKTLLMPSDANWTKGSEYDMECLANVAASALFVALVDDDWVQEQAHLRFFAVAVRCTEARLKPRIFVIHDKEFRYKEDLALRAFKFSSSNSASVRRHESVLLPYELMDRVFASKGYWHDLVEAGPMVRCLSADEGAALLGGALPLEARLRSQVSRRRGLLQASEAALGGQRTQSGRPHESMQQMILPTFTRPDIHFNPYIP